MSTSKNKTAQESDPVGAIMDAQDIISSILCHEERDRQQKRIQNELNKSVIEAKNAEANAKRAILSSNPSAPNLSAIATEKLIKAISAVVVANTRK